MVLMSVGLSGQVSLCHDNSRLGNKKLQCYSQEEKHHLLTSCQPTKSFPQKQQQTDLQQYGRLQADMSRRDTLSHTVYTGKPCLLFQIVYQGITHIYYPASCFIAYLCDTNRKRTIIASLCSDHVSKGFGYTFFLQLHNFHGKQVEITKLHI